MIYEIVVLFLSFFWWKWCPFWINGDLLSSNVILFQHVDQQTTDPRPQAFQDVPGISAMDPAPEVPNATQADPVPEVVVSGAGLVVQSEIPAADRVPCMPPPSQAATQVRIDW